MATKFRLRRSATADKRPVESDLLLGELALNTYDGRLYTKRDTNNVGIADTAALLTPWTENFGGGSIFYDNSVGIGTTNPETRLHVSDGHLASANDFDSNVVFAISKNTTTSSWAGLALNSGNAAGAFIHFGDTDDSNVGRLDYDHTANSFKFFTNGNTTERLTITSAGDVTTTGTSTFSRANAGFTARSGDSVSITRAGGTPLEITRTTAQGNMINFFDTDGTTQRANIQLDSNDLVFGLTAEKLRITSAGRVGIGSEIPDYMLDVSGAINSETDVKVGGVSVSETALNDAVAMAIALG